MTNLIHSSESYRVDTTTPVCLLTEVGPNAVAGVIGHRFLLYVNEQRTNVVDDQNRIDISTRMKRVESDPRRAKALAKARAGLGRWMVEEPTMSGQSLAALRLQSGLSQTQLAEKLGTQQSNVSRLENNPSDVQVSTVMKLAEALQRPATEVFGAIVRQLGARA